jgi:hypothetical protein
MRRYNQGWKCESERHSLAARGVKTKFDRMPWWKLWGSTEYYRSAMKEMGDDTVAGMKQKLAEEKRVKLKRHALTAKGKYRYTVMVDYGKPYDVKVGSDTELKKELLKLKKIAQSEEYAQFDIWVYDKNEIDVTDKVFKKLKIN